MSTRNDRDLDDLLSDEAGRIGASYRKLGKLEPPRRLDRNVLAEASRAVHGRPRASRWLLGVGTAAGVLLAAGIGWRVNHDMAQQREVVPMSSPAIENAPAGVIRVEPHADAGGKASRSDTISPADNQPNTADAEALGAAKSASGSPVESKAAQAKQKLDKDFVPDPTVMKIVPKPARMAASKQEDVREQAAPMSAPDKKSQAGQPKTIDSGRTTFPRPPIEGKLRIPPPPDVSKPAPTSIGDESMPTEIQSASAPAPMQEAESAHDNAVGAANTVSQDNARRERSSSSTSTAAMAEIDRIRALLRAGQRDAALEALRQLRREHPSLVLPADLRGLDG